MKTYVVMLAGGKGSRMNAAVNKILLPVCGRSVIRRSAEAFVSFADEMIVVCRPEEEQQIREEFGNSSLSFPFRFASGGETRQASVLNGLAALSPSPEDIILIHDAARCLVGADVIRRVIDGVIRDGAAVPALPATSTFKVCDPDGFVVHTPERSSLYEIQTPQGFRTEMIIPYAMKAAEEQFLATDDAGLLEHYQVPVRVVEGSPSNIKLTEPGDLTRAESILKGVASSMRIGMGYDVHRLTPDRKLILCGVEIPFDLGLLGHSDADVALHALMDAMLGACALGDIGKHFPDTEDRYRGISSVLLLEETASLLSEKGFRVFNADITIVAQKPKLLPYIPDMIRKVALTLNLPENCISVKATTTEKLGFEGRTEGISAYAVCSVVETDR